MVTDLAARQPLREIARSVQSKRVRAVERVRHALDRIGLLNGRLNALREVLGESAMQRAAAIDAEAACGAARPLAGVLVAVKDNICTAEGTTTAGSRMLEGYRSPFSATAVARIEAAGGIVIGRANCDEFGMGSTNEHGAYGAVRNPWDETRVPGGSSGGSACAVAAGLADAALGSDTGGSVRLPSSFCGTVGLKPGYGRVSRWGLIAYGSSLDQIGPITARVDDAALMLEVMAGADPLDSTCAEDPVPEYTALMASGAEPLRIGVARQHRRAGDDPAARRVVDDLLARLAGAGASIVEIDLTLTDALLAAYYVIATAEASSNLARYDGIRYGHRARQGTGPMDLESLYARSRAEGLGREVRRRIMLGSFVLSAGYADAYYHRALQVRRLVHEEYARAFQHCHVIAGPVAPSAAFPLGHVPDPLSMYLTDVYTVGANVAGIPAISVPAGFVESGGSRLPVGIQLQAASRDESTLLRAARQVERLAAAEGR